MIKLGKITKPQGVMGNVRVHSYCEEPRNIFSYGKLYDKDSKDIPLQFVRIIKNDMIEARIAGVQTRETANQFINTDLYIHRDQLPDLAQENSFYYHDYMNTPVYDEHGDFYGHVFDIKNYGSGEFLEIKTEEKKTITAFFHKDSIISASSGKIVLKKDFIVLP